MRLLLVEDNRHLNLLVAGALRGAGFTVDAVSNVSDGEAAIAVATYDAVVLDLGLPDRDGMELLEIARQRGVSTPILLLTARDDASSVVAGLNGGADDYLRKPFDMDELIARVRALLRRPRAAVSPVLHEGNVELDAAARRVRIGSSVLDLSRRETAALELLMRRAGTVISKPALEDTLYGFGEEVSSNAIEVLIHRLRRKLASIGADVEIHTLRGIGYLLAGRQA
ncbi:MULTISPECIES: response regulator [Xanthobacter]|uniref:response regulator n=1 Tax=Xanthobacter TaxID=279 RepID=UPI001F188E2A|nr:MULTISPECIES: response regulator transcription factor [unclassified Xanthobacter]